MKGCNVFLLSNPIFLSLMEIDCHEEFSADHWIWMIKLLNTLFITYKFSDLWPCTIKGFGCMFSCFILHFTWQVTAPTWYHLGASDLVLSFPLITFLTFGPGEDEFDSMSQCDYNITWRLNLIQCHYKTNLIGKLRWMPKKWRWIFGVKFDWQIWLTSLVDRWFSFPIGWFLGSMLIFRGSWLWKYDYDGHIKPTPLSLDKETALKHDMFLSPMASFQRDIKVKFHQRSTSIQAV